LKETSPEAGFSLKEVFSSSCILNIADLFVFFPLFRVSSPFFHTCVHHSAPTHCLFLEAASNLTLPKRKRAVLVFFFILRLSFFPFFSVF